MSEPNACDTCGTDIPVEAGAFCSRCALAFELDRRDGQAVDEFREWVRGGWAS